MHRWISASAVTPAVDLAAVISNMAIVTADTIGEEQRADVTTEHSQQRDDVVDGGRTVHARG